MEQSSLELGYIPFTEKQMSDALVRHRVAMLEYASRRFRLNQSDSEDLVGEVAYKVLKARLRYNPDKSAISTYLFKVMLNCYIDNLRADKRRPKTQSGLNMSAQDPVIDTVVEGSDVGDDNFIQLLTESINRLPRSYGHILRLRMEGLDFIEIALELSMPIGTIKTNIRSARRILIRSLLNNGLITKDLLGPKRFYMAEEDLANRTQKYVDTHSLLIAKIARSLLIETKPRK